MTTKGDAIAVRARIDDQQTLRLLVLSSSQFDPQPHGQRGQHQGPAVWGPSTHDFLYLCDFTPVNTLLIRVEQAQIRDDVPFVVNGQYGIGGSGVGDIGIEWRLLHCRSRNRLLRQFEPSGPKSANKRHRL
jgi:hypothetical protein